MAIDFTRNLQVGIATEATFNTHTVVNEEGFRFLPGATMVTEQDVRSEPSARGQAGESPLDIAQGLRRCRFTGAMNLPKEALCFWLARLFGASVTTTITAFFKHVISINDPALGTSATPTSMSMRLLDDNKEWRLSGCAVQSIKLTMLLNNFWRVDVEVIGSTYTDETIGALPTYTVPAANAHFLKSDDFTFAVNSTTFLPNTFEVTFRRGYADGDAESYAAGAATDAAGRERVRLESAGAPAFETFGTMSRIYDGVAEFDLFDGFTEFDISCETRLNAGEDLQVIGSDGYGLKVNLAKCHMETWDKGDSAGLTMQTFAFRAYYSGTSTDIQVTTQDKVDGTASGLPNEGTP